MTEVAMPRNRAWAALRCYVADALLTSGGVLRRLLGADPPAGFEIATATPGATPGSSAGTAFARQCWRWHTDVAGLVDEAEDHLPESVDRLGTGADARAVQEPALKRFGDPAVFVAAITPLGPRVREGHSLARGEIPHCLRIPPPGTTRLRTQAPTKLHTAWVRPPVLTPTTTA